MIQRYNNINKEHHYIIKYNTTQTELNKLQDEIVNTESYIDSNVHKVIKLLEESSFIERFPDNSKYKLTLKGLIASQIREVHCILFADLTMNDAFHVFTTNELVAIFSCFANVTVSEDLRCVLPNADNKLVENAIIEIVKKKQNIEDNEYALKINTGTSFEMQFDLISYTYNWCECNNIEECKLLIHQMEIEKGIFLGEFVKALLKINNIAVELEKVAECIGNIEFLHKLREIPKKTLKYVVTNQSLYV